MMLRCVIVKTVELVELIDVCKTDSFGETILVPHSCHNYRHYYYHFFCFFLFLFRHSEVSCCVNPGEQGGQGAGRGNRRGRGGGHGRGRGRDRRANADPGAANPNQGIICPQGLHIVLPRGRVLLDTSKQEAAHPLV